MSLDQTLREAFASPESLDVAAIAGFLACDDPAFWRGAFAAAAKTKRRCGLTTVLPRALIETSNLCVKDCLYCGIRASARGFEHYRMDEREVLALCEAARRRDFTAVAFQAGEVESEANTAFFERVLEKCRDLEVTLSLGEQGEDVYRRWRAAGALKYLIRIETSNRELYAKIHPKSCSFDRRLDCIRTLKRLGYVTGSGVMIGIPGQTIEDLARDLVFFREERLDMIGMGPYVPCPHAPLAAPPSLPISFAYRMIALARLILKDKNIVAASALAAVAGEEGIARAIDVGANVIMPNFTPEGYRRNYGLYPRKSEAQAVMKGEG